MTKERKEITGDKITHLAHTIQVRLRDSIQAIQSVNDDIHVLSINAKILAAKAGTHGRAFAVVADEVRSMAGRTRSITEKLSEGVERTVGELTDLNELLGTKMRAERLSQVAGSMIDIVDRNLYERSCDVRWWATEQAVIDLAQESSPIDSDGGADEEFRRLAARCSKRLATILDSYTVYLDIVLCGTDGTILANGREERFKSAGGSVRDSLWFYGAKATVSGREYAFESVRENPLVGGMRTLVYSCAVREKGDPDGRITGVLGILFDWDSLASVVAARAADMLSAETGGRVDAFLADSEGRVLVRASAGGALAGGALTGGALTGGGDKDSAGCAGTGTIPRTAVQAARSRERGILLPETGDCGDFRGIAGFARSQGYETYRTGWCAFITEEKNDRRS